MPQELLKQDWGVSSDVLDPMPKADPVAVAAWLVRTSRGALIAAGLILVEAAAVLLAFWGVSLGKAAALIGCLRGLAMALGIWLITTPEPENGRWLWYLRWPARVLAVVGIALAVGSGRALAGPLIPPPDEAVSRSTPDLIRKMLLVLAGVTWTCLFWYVTHLAHRVRDRLCEACCAVVTCVMGIVTALGIPPFLTALVRAPLYYAKATAREKQAQPMSDLARYAVLLLAFLVYCWFAWLMWRLFRRLRRAARQVRQQVRAVQGPA